MKKILVPILFCFASLLAKGNGRDSTLTFTIPDSIRAVQYMAEISVENNNNTKRVEVGITTYVGSVFLAQSDGKKSIQYRGDELHRIVSLGQGVKDIRFGRFSFEYDWKEHEAYRMMISIATDSATQLLLYSAYIFLPRENKWKFLVCRKASMVIDRITNPGVYISTHKKNAAGFVAGNAWIMQNTGTWKNLKGGADSPPPSNFYNHLDSLVQSEEEHRIINNAMRIGTTDVTNVNDGIYYKIIQQGNGKKVTVTDTVTAFYRLTLFRDTAIIDETKDKPATFPLQRLIKGWQVGLPLINEGGIIKLVIPSGLGYSIRTRSPKIPPNSILEFKIEIVSTKPKE